MQLSPAFIFKAEKMKIKEKRLCKICKKVIFSNTRQFCSLKCKHKAYYERNKEMRKEYSKV